MASSGSNYSVRSSIGFGNEQGRRLGDEVAGTQVLDAGRLALPD